MAQTSHTTTDDKAQSRNETDAQELARFRAGRLREKFENDPMLHNHTVIYSPVMPGVIVVANEIDYWIVAVLENDNLWQVHHTGKGEVAVYAVYEDDS